MGALVAATDNEKIHSWRLKSPRFKHFLPNMLYGHQGLVVVAGSDGRAGAGPCLVGRLTLADGRQERDIQAEGVRAQG